MASSSQIKPNEKGTITVKVNTADRKGLIVENAEVMTNDPRHPLVTLTIRAYVSDIDLPFSPPNEHFVWVRGYLEDADIL